jgi:pathogenesis-related protein 1
MHERSGLATARWSAVAACTGLLIAGALLLRAQGPPTGGGAILAAHNARRAAVGVEPLAWSDDLAEAARKWADRLIATGSFEHNPAGPFGENIFEIRGGTATAEEVVAAWSTEERGYDYRTNLCRGVCGHYTQIVWRETTRVGCAAARSADREIWVCEYNPPGNYIGERPY